MDSNAAANWPGRAATAGSTPSRAAISSRRHRRRQAVPAPANNSVRRAYDLLRTRLPSLGPETALVESDLVAALSASRTTVRAVLQRLAAEGLIDRRPKIGTHAGSSVVIPVDRLSPIESLAANQPMHARLLETSVIPAPRLVAERLELAPETPVRVFESIVLNDGSPIALAVSYIALPAGTDTNLHRPFPESTITFVEEHLNFPVYKADTVVVAIACDRETAELLAVPEGSPVLFVEDLLRSGDERPRALSQFRFRANGVALSATALRATVPQGGHP